MNSIKQGLMSIAESYSEIFLPSVLLPKRNRETTEKPPRLAAGQCSNLVCRMLILDTLEHCIEHLRQSIMCSGDFALDSWLHDDEDDMNYLNTEVTHVCRDYANLNDWAEKNAWDLQ